MAKRTVEHSPLYRRIGFGFTAHPITVWAGVILLRLYFEWIKLREELGEALVGLTKHSNHQISSVDVMMSWFYGLALGAERFEHFSRYRRDRLLGELWGLTVWLTGYVEAVVFAVWVSGCDRGERAADAV